jgi:hypothetical protein
MVIFVALLSASQFLPRRPEQDLVDIHVVGLADCETLSLYGGLLRYGPATEPPRRVEPSSLDGVFRPRIR